MFLLQLDFSFFITCYLSLCSSFFLSYTIKSCALLLFPITTFTLMSTCTSAFKFSYTSCTKGLFKTNYFTCKLVYTSVYYVYQFSHTWEFRHNYAISCVSFISPLHHDKIFILFFLNKVYRKFILVLQKPSFYCSSHNGSINERRVFGGRNSDSIQKASRPRGWCTRVLKNYLAQVWLLVSLIDQRGGGEEVKKNGYKLFQIFPGSVQTLEGMLISYFL